MNNKLFAITLLMFVFSPPVFSLSVIFEGGKVSRISGIDIGGEGYDAIIHYDVSFSDIWSTDTPDWLFSNIDLTTQQSIFAGVSSDMSNAGLTPDDFGGVTGIFAPISLSQQLSYVNYPGSVLVQSLASWTGSNWTTVGTIGFPTSYTGTYASFEQTSIVPLPAAVWLFSSGLLGFIGVARRKNADCRV